MWVAQRDEVLCDPGEKDDHERGQQPVPQQVQHLSLPENIKELSEWNCVSQEDSSLEDSTTTGRKSLCATLHHNIWICVGAAAVFCEL